MPARRAALVEAGIVGAVGATLAAAAGSVVGVPAMAGVVGAANGVIGGARGVYDWRRPAGVVAFVVDSTWALVPVAGGLAVHALSAARCGSGYVDDLSRRRNRHVYAGGFVLRAGFALSVGNVVTGAAGRDDVDLADGSTRAQSRRRLVERHEQRHVHQARVWGPAFPLLYGCWSVLGAIAGTIAWIARRPASWSRCVETCAYYDNPFEVVAYRADDHWPPRGAVASLTWGHRARSVRG